jgi:multidrug efflux pump subunit AcrA (membrane-fusion protein)
MRRFAVGITVAVTLAACQSADAPGTAASPESSPSDAAPAQTNAGTEPRDPDAPIEARATVLGGEFFAIVDGKAEAVRVPFTGELIRLDVADGELVSAGDILGVISTEKVGDRAPTFGRNDSLEVEIIAAERQVAQAERELLRARREVQSLQLLDEERRQFPGEYPDREAERLALIGAYEADLRRGRDVLLAASRAAVIELLDAVRAEQRSWEDALRDERFAVQTERDAQARLEFRLAQRERRIIRSPQDGIVRLQDQFADDFGTTEDLAVGATLLEREIFARVVAVDRPTALVAVPDGFVAGVVAGDRVEIEFEAAPGQMLGGVVVDVSDTDRSGFPGSTRTYEFFAGPGAFGFDVGTGGVLRRDTEGSDFSGARAGPAQSIFVVEVELDAAGRPPLRPGMTGIATFSGSARGVEVVAEVSELDVHRLDVGAAVTVEIDAFPEQAIDGTVIGVGRIPRVVADEVTYRVRVRLEPSATADLQLRTGLRGTVRFP